MNTAFLIGRLTKDPELKKTNSDLSICDFTIAVDRPYQKGEDERKVDFINCTAFRGLADTLVKYMSKGSMIAVTGAIQVESYTASDGTQKKTTKVICDKVMFLSKQEKAEAPILPNDFDVKKELDELAKEKTDPFKAFKPRADLSDKDLPF